MKTKSKVLACVEIAIVMGSLFLVALPAIAAEEDDFVLGIYGNANEDDTVDMRDLTYVKLIFFGKKPETELADAKYDGKINPLDFIQIKLIIVGKEKELTIVQYLKYPEPYYHTEEPVTVPMPIESLAALGGSYGPYTVCAMGETDKIVAVGTSGKKRGEIRDLIEDIPAVGSTKVWDMEMILELNPDIVLAYACYDFSEYRETLDAAGIPLVQMDFHKPEKYSNEISNLGWMLKKQERAEELISFEQQHLGLIEERVKDLSDEQKPRVYAEGYRDYQYSSASSISYSISPCGGIDIFDEIEGTVDIDPEEVIIRDPEVIIKVTAIWYMSDSGYDATGTGQMEEKRDDIMSRPAWDDIDAVENERVYIITTDAASVHPSIFNSYVAKWLHPDLFEDMDPVAIHEEWLQEFLGVEFKGVYAYPPPASW